MILPLTADCKKKLITSDRQIVETTMTVSTMVPHDSVANTKVTNQKELVCLGVELEMKKTNCHEDYTQTHSSISCTEKSIEIFKFPFAFDRKKDTDMSKCLI